MIPNPDSVRRFSPWLARQLDSGRLDRERLSHWLERPLDAADLAAFADWPAFQAAGDEAALSAALRVLRRHVLAQIMVRDLCGAAPLDEVTRSITLLADFAVNTALEFAESRCRALYGTPIGRHSGKEQRLSVVAMGKAGGFELNVSSDLDLIFVYPEAGETDGRRSRDNQEFFTKVGQKLIALLDHAESEGFVFRTDMRLRPDGDSGALVISETALEQYLVSQGREWERYAWCKARVVTPHENGIAALVRPFVFRRYLDYRAYEAMRGLHRQIRAEVSRKGLHDNIKLGAGGIREIEFAAQIFQMIRGGQNRALQLKGTQETLEKLAEHGILDAGIARGLLDAYRFLRRCEHRLQYWDDQQTQTLPESEEQRQLLAESMGFADYPAFSGCLEQHRARVSAVFADVLGGSGDAAENDGGSLWQQLDATNAADTLGKLGFQAASAQALAELKHSSWYRRLSAAALPLFDAVLPRAIEAAAASSQPDTALPRLTEFLKTVSRRPSYLAFLQQHPAALAQLAELNAQSGWLSDYLQRHPALLDELLSAQLMQPLDWQTLEQNLAAALDACGSDTEAAMDALRHFQHAQIFRLAVQDLAGRWSVESLSDELSRLADLVLAQALRGAWRSIAKPHRPEPQFAVIGYGKLGGKELGYSSDLDLVYLYEDEHPDAADTYAKLARRLGTWLSGSTGAGTLYDIDLRLRPNGDAGFLVHSLTAFEKYQREEAWTWEHQALSRARFVCGSRAIGGAFERIRRSILAGERDTAALREDIAAMRAKIAASHPPQPENVKYAAGGIVDVEFCVQYLILAHSRRHPELLENYGNIALLEMAARRRLADPQQAAAAVAAYRRFRYLQHRTSLHDQQPEAAAAADYAAVRTLWRSLFGSETPAAANSCSAPVPAAACY